MVSYPLFELWCLNTFYDMAVNVLSKEVPTYVGILMRIEVLKSTMYSRYEWVAFLFPLPILLLLSMLLQTQNKRNTLFLGKHMRDQASFSPGVLFHLPQSAKLRKSPQDSVLCSIDTFFQSWWPPFLQLAR
jgi:hypothetical protein